MHIPTRVAVYYHWLESHKVQIIANQVLWHPTSFNGCLSGILETFNFKKLFIHFKLHTCQLRYLSKHTLTLSPPGKDNKYKLPVCKELNICALAASLMI